MEAVQLPEDAPKVEEREVPTFNELLDQIIKDSKFRPMVQRDIYSRRFEVVDHGQTVGFIPESGFVELNKRELVDKLGERVRPIFVRPEVETECKPITEFADQLGIELKPHQKNMFDIVTLRCFTRNRRRPVSEEKQEKQIDGSDPNLSDPNLEMVEALGQQLACLCEQRKLLSARARIDHEYHGDTTTIEVEVERAKGEPVIITCGRSIPDTGEKQDN
jgi:hypothetical protein